jgi:hypothetical protein
MTRSIANKFLSILLFILFLPGINYAQELLCQVVVNAQQVQSTERAIYREMEVTFARFMNDMKWTNEVYQTHERIRCNLNITINSMPAIGIYTANVQECSGAIGQAYL